MKEVRSLVIGLLVGAGCAGQVGSEDEPVAGAEGALGYSGGGDDDDDSDSDEGGSIVARIRAAAEAAGMEAHPTADRYSAGGHTPEELATIRERADLGRFLFFDHVLSGVEQTSCATCHHAAFQFADGRNIARGVFCTLSADGTSIDCDEAPAPGTGGNVVGPARTSPLNQRNTPSVINTALFPKQMWNGRFAFVDDSSIDVNYLDASLGFSFPAPENVLFTRSLLTGQAHIPVTEAIEMTGDFPTFGQPFPPPEVRNDLIRNTLADILGTIPAYRALFESAYGPGTQVFPQDPTVGAGDPIPYLAIADAMAHFEEQDLVMTDSPWDDFLAGDDHALSRRQQRGALVFFGRGQCVDCHTGSMFSDFENHNIGVPQVGPGTGKSDLSDPAYGGLNSWDFGGEELTGARGDRFKFRTPPLRGVALQSPFMHNGAYATLEDAILHHVNPRRSYRRYDDSQVEPDMQAFGVKPLGPVFDAQNPVVIGPGTAIRPRLSRRDVRDLVAFLRALTDPRMHDTADLAPATLPSGLPPDVPGPRAFPIYP